ncbi:MAG: adenosine-specific kinase, partial [Nitrososphaerota archaeon]
MELKLIKLDIPKDCQIILGQSHFIKTVEDLHEAMVNSVPGIKFGLAFCESSGPCLVRHSGTDEELEKIAAEQALKLGAGHCFLIIMRGAYPINVL